MDVGAKNHEPVGEHPLVIFVVVAALYWLFAEIGHALSFPGHFATFWLPSGLALAAFLWVATQRWPAVIAATLLANVVSDVVFHEKSLLVSLGFWLSNTTESLTAVWFIRQFDPRKDLTATVRSVLIFVLLVCPCSTAVGATLGATVVWLAFDGVWLTLWQIWWSGDFVGMLITFPFVWMLLGIWTKWKTRCKTMAALRPMNAGVFVGLLIAHGIITHFVFGLQSQRLAYVVFPMLLWLVMRYDVTGATNGLFVLALITVADTAAGRGLFGGIPELPTRALVLQIFLFVSASTFLTLAATVRERRFAQKELYRTQTALDTAADAVLWVKPDGQLFYVNDEACRRLKYSRSELLSMTVADINPDLESTDAFREIFWPRILEQKQMSLEMRHQRSDDTIFPVEILTHYIEFEGEEFACSFVRDTTDRRKQEQLFRTVVESAVAGLVIVDVDGIIVIANQEAERIFGYDSGALLGQSIEVLVPEASRDVHVKMRRDFFDNPERRTMAEGRILAGMRSDGSQFSVEVGLTPMVTDGEAYVLSVIMDITARLKAAQELEDAHQKFESLVQMLGATDGAWNWDLSTDVVDYSPRFRELLGYDADDVEGFPNTLKSFHSHVHPQDIAEVRQSIDRHLQDGSPFDHEFRMQRMDGSYRWFHARGTALRDTFGKPGRMAGSIYDVTGRKTAELKLRESNSDLEQFAYVASHDLQEPLRAVGGFCQLLERRYHDSLDEKGRGYISKAVEGTNRMTALINDLLEFSRIGRDTHRFTQTPLSEAVATAIRQMSVSIEETDAIIDVDDLPRVMGDSTLLSQLFQNLIGNAIKFRRPDIPPTIRISAVQSESFCDVSVQDNGIGIEAAHTDQIFTIFKRLHRREEIAGTGIGLAICKRIVERHRGRLSVVSIPGTGSTFTFRLPTEELRNV